MRKLQKCTVNDYDQFIDFINDAFDKKEEKWFIKHLPNIYLNKDNMTDEMIGYNYFIKENDKIMAAIGIFPLHIRTKYGNKTIELKMAGIGSVSTGKEYRGQHLMSDMLVQVNEIIRQEGYHISWLAGERFRYQNYGWNIGGKQYNVTLNKKTILRNYIQEDAVSTGKIAQREDITSLININNACITTINRIKDNWINTFPKVKYRFNDEAYIQYSESNPSFIMEMCGSIDSCVALLKGHIEEYNIGYIKINTPYDKSELTTFLLDHCEDYIVSNIGKMQVLDIDSIWEMIEEPLIDQMKEEYKEDFIKKLCTEEYKADVIHNILRIHNKDSKIDCNLPMLSYWYPLIDHV